MYLSGHVTLGIHDARGRTGGPPCCGDALRLSPADELTVRQASHDSAGRLYVRLQQRATAACWSLHSEVAVQIDADGAMNTVLGELVPDISAETTPALTGDAAIARALSRLVVAGRREQREDS